MLSIRVGSVVLGSSPQQDHGDLLSPAEIPDRDPSWNAVFSRDRRNTPVHALSIIPKTKPMQSDDPDNAKTCK
jgi:hypothetical protein